MNSNRERSSVLGKNVKGLVALCMILACTGCNNGQLPTYPVQGQLRFEDGTRPMFGDVEFYNAQHKLNARGKIKRDGTFSVGTYDENDGAIAGEHKIVIQQHTGTPLTSRIESPIKHDHGQLIHSDYFDYRTSELKCTIVKGDDNRVELIVRKNPRQTEEGMPEE